MQIILLCKGQLESVPPVMTVALGASQLGHDATILTSFCQPTTKLSLLSNGVKVFALCEAHIACSKSMHYRILHWLQFRNRAWRYLKNNQDLLWIATGDTAIALGNQLHNTKFILQLLELYDTLPIYRRLLKPYALKAKCLVVPEEFRAAVFQVWYGLKQMPFVLPNKPIKHPRNPKLRIEDANAKLAIDSIDDKEKIILYQGHIGPGRDLQPIAEAIFNLRGSWRLVLMGAAYDNYLNMLRTKCPNLVWIPNIVAPLHLQVTSHAHIGIIHYTLDSLNNLFCAPNKIWEYSGFGIPMISNDLPPLRKLINESGAGKCVSPWTSNAIISALENISSCHRNFARASFQLYNSVNITDRLRDALDASLDKLSIETKY